MYCTPTYSEAMPIICWDEVEHHTHIEGLSADDINEITQAVDAWLESPDLLQYQPENRG